MKPSRTNFCAVLALLLFVVLSAPVGQAQAITGAPAGVSRKERAPQVMVRVISYDVRNVGAVRKRYPVLIGEPLQALANKEVFRTQLADAARRGWIDINSRPQGIVQNGATLDLSTGYNVPLAIHDGHPSTGTITTVLTAGRRLVATPRVTLQGVELKFSIDDDQTASGSGIIDRRSVEGTVFLRPDETAIVGGFRMASGGRLTLYSIEAATIDF
jgi:hypothetical protein